MKSLVFALVLLSGCSSLPRPSVSFADPLKTVPDGGTISPTVVVEKILLGFVSAVNGERASQGWEDREYFVMLNLTWEW